ncbi:hypothetical protein R6Q59_032599 [Mikania micrantha]
MLPGNQSESYAPITSSFRSFCNTISSCLSLLCCCCLFQNCCLGGRRRATPLINPAPDQMNDRLRGNPPGPMDDHFVQLGGPHSPFVAPNPPVPHSSWVHHPRPTLLYEPPALPEPHIPSVQPGLL